VPTDAEFDAQVETLTRINTAEFLSALGVGQMRWGRSALERLVRPAARQIAQDMARFDRMLGHRGLYAGAKEVLTSLVKHLEVMGAGPATP
jgi:hypothetical protein